MLNDPDIRFYLRRVFPLSERQEEKWLESLDSNNENIVLIIQTLNGESIGTMGLHKISWIDSTAETGALIGEKEYWDGGYGTDAKMILLYHAFQNMGLRKICSAVFEFNGRSMAYLKKAGYRKEGRLKNQVLRDGKYWDEVRMAVFKEDFLEVWQKYKEEHNL